MVDSGHGRTHVVPIYEGFAIPHATFRLPTSGQTFTGDLFSRLDAQSGFARSLTDDNITWDLEQARGIKETYCKVSSDYDGTLKVIREGGHVDKTRKYKLPGTHKELVIEVEALIGVPENLFQPLKTSGEREYDCLHKGLHEAAFKCDPEIRASLFRNIVLAGGTTMMDGFKQRVQKEIDAICTSAVNP